MQGGGSAAADVVAHGWGWKLGYGSDKHVRAFKRRRLQRGKELRRRRTEGQQWALRWAVGTEGSAGRVQLRQCRAQQVSLSARKGIKGAGVYVRKACSIRSWRNCWRRGSRNAAAGACPTAAAVVLAPPRVGWHPRSSVSCPPGVVLHRVLRTLRRLNGTKLKICALHVYVSRFNISSSLLRHGAAPRAAHAGLQPWLPSHSHFFVHAFYTTNPTSFPLLPGVVLHRALRTLGSSRGLQARLQRLDTEEAVDYYYRTLLGPDWRAQMQEDYDRALKDVNEGLVTGGWRGCDGGAGYKGGAEGSGWGSGDQGGVALGVCTA